MAVNARSENADSTVSGTLSDDIAIPAMSNPPARFLDTPTCPVSPALSPARSLQHHLDAQLAGFNVQITDTGLPGEKPKWSTRRTLALVVAINGVAWTALVWAVAALIR
ncbi:hypothetical protein GCM10007420_06940 [Glycocaulis albus]|uniref:Transmembrane protein n=1 Tax=Glycocaulis albus TaxID=1382801 RepID=A0ABQ1XI04_9PROT|nr:hypothetical protein [Glycocaulis albus]MBV5258722.1 hypothetical protein [Synechococcus moorigangaii CMS01]GGG94086.1 hypothetical protein GCM10007420_06940 [Glycocaulis albus]